MPGSKTGPVESVVLSGAFLLLSGLFAGAAAATPQESITVTDTFYATGTLNGNPFTDQPITVTGVGFGTVFNFFASNPTHKPDWRIDLQTVTLSGSLDGAPATPFSTTVTDPVFAFVNTRTNTGGLSSLSSPGGSDLVDVQPAGGQFYSYGLNTDIAVSGPEPEEDGYVPFTYDTAAGTLVVSNFDSNAAFGATVLITLANLEGGAPGNPTPLPIGGPIGDITGAIGGAQGSTDFYALAWSGGAFGATLSLTGAVAGSSYAFELLDAQGNLIDTSTLDQADGFSGALNSVLAAGDYEIGIKSDGPMDPDFDLQFSTPVQGVAVPEPGTWAMLLLGFGGVGASLRAGRFRRSASPEERKTISRSVVFNS